jgi:hypothetical protein
VRWHLREPRLGAGPRSRAIVGLRLRTLSLAVRVESLDSRVRNCVLTIFTFGYWGWGNSTRELIKVIDATERKRGFKPPVFFDIRLSRSVRAVGFRGDSFGRRLPRWRYRWLPQLGNENIKTRNPRIKIKDPFSSRILLAEAREYARDNRRIIFYCACEFPCNCHRRVVANLLLKDSKREGHKITITEWPGGTPVRARVRVTSAIYREVCKGRVSVRLANNSLQRDLLALPWGSRVELVSGKEILAIITGPAKFQNGWVLPIWFQDKPNKPTARLNRDSEKWLRRIGIRNIQSSSER